MILLNYSPKAQMIQLPLDMPTVLAKAAAQAEAAAAAQATVAAQATAAAQAAAAATAAAAQRTKLKLAPITSHRSTARSRLWRDRRST